MEPALNLRMAAVLLGLSVLAVFAFAFGLEAAAIQRIAHSGMPFIGH